MTATALRLYQATDALLEVKLWIVEHESEIIAAGGEMPPELAELVELAEGQFEEKIERVALFIRELLGTAKVAKEEADRLAKRAKAMEAAAESLKNGYLRWQMYRANVPAVKRPLATVRIQRNSAPSLALSVDPKTLPDALRRDIPEQIIPARSEENREAIVALWKPAYDEALAWAKKSDMTLAEAEEFARAKAAEALPAGVHVELGSHVRIA
jgi:hypothetical protein